MIGLNFFMPLGRGPFKTASLGSCSSILVEGSVFSSSTGLGCSTGFGASSGLVSLGFSAALDLSAYLGF